MVEHRGLHRGHCSAIITWGAAKGSVQNTAGAGAVFYPTASVRGDLAHRVTLHELGGVGSEARRMGRGNWE
jgi:hypothetical protein